MFASYRRTVGLVAASAALIAPAPAQAACPDEDLLVTADTADRAAAATLCLHNERRTAHGLAGLRPSPELASSALGHSRDMVARRYFAHVSPDGQGPVDRIRASGYLTGASSWAIGENIAWGSGSYSTPRRIMESWMASPSHRENLLNGRFMDVGIGVVAGTHLGSPPPAGTYTVNFGVRPPPGGAPPASAPVVPPPPPANRRPVAPAPKRARCIRRGRSLRARRAYIRCVRRVQCLRRAGKSRRRQAVCIRRYGRR